MIKIGIAKQDLEPILTPKRELTDERVEAVAFYAESESLRAVWIELDFMDFNFHVVTTLQNAVSRATGIPTKHIHILTTHNHGGGEPDWDDLGEYAAKAAVKAAESARPALMRGALCDVVERISHIRRMYVPELGMSTTLWWGADCTMGFDSSPHTEYVINELKEGRLAYMNECETTRPPKPFDVSDPMTAVMEFISVDGEKIGTVIRFSSHATCSNRADYYSGDFPYNVRAEMEKHFGGTSIFFNGPCADIAPAMRGKFDGSSKKMGRVLMETAVKALDGLEFEEISVFDDAKAAIKLPVRREVLENRIDLPESMPDDLTERLKYLEAERTQNTLPFLQEKYAHGEKTLSDKVEISFGMMRLNDFVFAGFPGETFSTTGIAVRNQFQNIKIIPLTEHDRTVMYLPPDDELPKGGYETVCRLTDAGAAETLAQGAIDALRKFLR